MIDIGVNLLHSQFDFDREEVLNRAWAAGVRHIVVTGTDVDSSRAAAAFVTEHASGRLSATAGIHPHHAHEAPEGWREMVQELCGNPGVVAVGETGLDFHRDFSPRTDQERLFREQLSLAAELAMPVFVHDRDAGDTVAACLEEVADVAAGVVVHCFTGSAADLDRYLDLGCFIGITGWVCDRRRGGPLRELMPRIPFDRLMIETDAPFLKPHNAPDDGRGRRNEPALLPWVARQIAELYGVAENEVEAATTANAKSFFRLDSPPPLPGT